MKRSILITSLFAAALISATPAAADLESFIGRWALTIPGGGAGWLGVTQEDGYIDASILWGGGSVVPVDSVWYNESNASLGVTRNRKVERKDDDGNVMRTHTISEFLMFMVDGDKLNCIQFQPRNDGTNVAERTFTGVRIPEIPAKPVLSKVKFGPAQDLLADGLSKWTLTNERQKNGWKLEDGVIINDVPEHGSGYGNLRTNDEYEDFNLSLDVQVSEGKNSGVYLRGIYEVQVLDSYGKDLDSHHMGAIYSRITPSVSAEKPAGEWQTLDMTLVDRHITVKLNGTTIIDNQPLLGCTGGALTSNEFIPGPIYLQGDHGPVNYRNIKLRPVQK